MAAVLTRAWEDNIKNGFYNIYISFKLVIDLNRFRIASEVSY